jgi:hypothetical protein
LSIDSAFTAVFFTNNYHSYAGGEYPSKFHDITIRNLTCTHASDKAIDMSGLPESPIRKVIFEEVEVGLAEKFASAVHADSVTFRSVWINGREIGSLDDM